MLEQVLAQGSVEAPALSAHSRLGCDFKNFLIAARPQARAGGAVPVHFLDPRFTTQNSSVTVASGPATVSKESSAFIVHVAAGAPDSSVVTLAIVLADNCRFFYTFRVAPDPAGPLTRYKDRAGEM
jgi:hypothetical protein